MVGVNYSLGYDILFFLFFLLVHALIDGEIALAFPGSEY